MKPVIFHTAAELELREAVAHYEGLRSGLGRELRQEIEAAVQRIRQMPRAFPRHDTAETRRCTAQRFPFAIFFIELPDTIWIAAVAHKRRRPNYWQKRRPE